MKNEYDLMKHEQKKLVLKENTKSDVIDNAEKWFPPGIEPRLSAFRADVLPLHHGNLTILSETAVLVPKYDVTRHDYASIKVVEEQRTLIYNEANTYIEGRCVTPPEACWRLFALEIPKKSYSVQRLDTHLPGQKRIANLNQTHEDLADIGQRGSTLKAYFKHNAEITRHNQSRDNISSRYHFYWQMPDNFTWIGRSSEWGSRVRHLRVIGRIHNVNFVAQPELYHLRLLLFHVKDATSFEDLRTVTDIQYQTSPENPNRLWEKFKENLSEDFIRAIRQNGKPIENAINRGYRMIARKLNTETTEGRNFQYWSQNFGFEDIDNYDLEDNQENLNTDESAVLGEQLYQLLKGRQIEVPRANKTELLDLSTKRYFLWSVFKTFKLEENMRGDIEQRQFGDYLLKLGNGELTLNTMEEI
ncbi:unnamed protein product, partial [Brenthis ino]